MNVQIEQLYQLAKKESRTIIGLMSGTSLDGLDIALCQISGSGETTKMNVLHSTTVDYSEEIKVEIRKVFAKQEIDFRHLALLNEWIGLLHADMILNSLQNWNVKPETVDLIASHGQTVMHAPKQLHGIKKFPNATLQIGDGDHIAVKTGIITVSDFRQKHVAAGGEGAPLAVYGDYFLFTKKGEHRILLNMGGIANFTYLPADLDPTKVFVTDTGTSNTLLDAFVRKYNPSLSYDKDAALASQGKAHKALLHELKNHPFFEKPFPKSTGPELFNIAYVEAAQKRASAMDIAVVDLLATLAHFTADTIKDALAWLVRTYQLEEKSIRIYASGGGMHNPLIMKLLQENSEYSFGKIDELGIAGDAKEAVLFALLANETVAGGKSNFGKERGVPSVSMGKISFPN